MEIHVIFNQLCMHIQLTYISNIFCTIWIQIETMETQNCIVDTSVISMDKTVKLGIKLLLVLPNFMILLQLRLGFVTMQNRTSIKHFINMVNHSSLLTVINKEVDYIWLQHSEQAMKIAMKICSNMNSQSFFLQRDIVLGCEQPFGRSVKAVCMNKTCS